MHPVSCRVQVVFAAAVAAFAVGPLRAGAQPPAVREVVAVRAPSPPAIDGRLDDAVWAVAPAASGFLQRDPVEGQPATEETRVQVAYDDNALYVAGRLLDRDPG